MLRATTAMSFCISRGIRWIAVWTRGRSDSGLQQDATPWPECPGVFETMVRFLKGGCLFLDALKHPDIRANTPLVAIRESAFPVGCAHLVAVQVAPVGERFSRAPPVGHPAVKAGL
mmetsp:Transcript_65775/g.109293  ORF Transcript_65775/g.109293 Transcript_65775/m.109293 type:complete len:116 (+) Transcript_65775:107-454(+)